MATYGLQTFDDAGGVVLDTRYVAGGVIAHVGVYAATATATLTFPYFAGRQVMIVPDWGWFFEAAASVSVDTTLGYPRLTVIASVGIRRFFVVAY